MKPNRLLFNIPWQLSAVFLLLSIGIILAGYLFYEKQREDLREDKEGELKAVADLKVGQIEDWYAERLRDADVMSRNPLLGPLIEAYVNGRSTGPTHEQVVEWMTLTKQIYHDRDIVLLDSKGNVLIGIPESPAILAPQVKEAISRAIQSKRVIVCDFHRESALHLIHLDLVIPVLCPRIDRTENDLVGLVILGIDPRKFLYPLIEFWPTPSKSAESILLRREGDEVVFLNELRHRENTALTLRFPVSGSLLPAALAVQGREGIVEGIDYRNVPVLAATRKVPGTPWFLIAKVDNEEVYAPIRERGLLILAVMCLLILASGASAAAFWRTEYAMQYKRQYEAEAARRVLLQRFEYLTKHANDIILLFDETYNIVEANDRAPAAYGYTHKELLGLNLKDIQFPSNADDLLLKMKEVEKSDGLVSETIHRRKDGSTFPVEVSSRAFRIEGRTFYQSIIRNITKRKQAEEDLYNANEMLQLVLDTIPQRVFWKDRNFSYIGCNKPFAKDAGLGDPSEIIAKDDFELAWKDRAHLYRADDNLVMETDTQKLDFEEPATTPNGGQIWVRTSKVPLHDRSGNVVGILGSYEDITERKRTEETVQRERNLLRTLIDNLPDLVYFKDAEGRYLLNNLPHLRSIGAEHQEDVLGKTTFDFNPRELALHYAEDEMQVVRSGKGLFDNEELALHRDTGEERWHLTSKVPLVDNQGKVTGIVGISRDITERKRAQQALLSERILLRTLIDNLPEAVYVKDTACRKTVANLADVRNTGRKSEAEVLGKDDFELFPTDVAAAFFADDQSVIQTGQPVLNREEFLYDPEGHKRWLLTSKLPLRDEKGEIIGLVGVGRDITKHKHAEEALLEAAEKFRLVFDNAFDGISIFEESPDPDQHRLVECNARYAEMAGRSREELLRIGNTRNLARALSEDNRTSIEGGVVFRGTFKWLRPDGRDNIIEYSSVPIKMQGKTYTIGIDRDITERKRAEEALSATETRYRLLFESAKDGIMIVDSETGQIADVNPFLIELLGYSKEELVGKGIWEIGSFRDLTTSKAAFDELTNRGHVRFENLPLETRDGHRIDVEFVSTAFLVDHRKAVQCNIRDISGRKRAEEALLKLYRAVEHTDEIIFMTEIDGTITYVNPAFEKIYGYTRAEAVGKTPRLLKGGALSRQYYEKFWRTLLAGEGVHGEVTNRTKDGRPISVSMSVNPILNNQGVLAGFIAVQADITEHRQMEEMLRQSEEQYRLIAENIADLIAVLDCDGRRIYNSPSYKDLLGDPEKLVGTDSFQEIHPEDRDKVRDIFRETVRTGIGQRTEYRFLLKDGSVRHIESQGSVIRGSDGNVSKVIVVSRDVTEKRRLEQQFLRAQRMESLGTLAGGIAHDLNNVLSPIMMAIELLRNKIPGEDGRRLLDTLETSARRGSDIVKQVLAFGRGLEGKRLLLDPKHIINEIVKIIGETFPKSIGMRINIRESLWTISADPTQMHQMLMNICVNARDAMPAGGYLTVLAENMVLDESYARMSREAKVGPYVAISVTDTGTGIPAGIVDKIFEPFFTTKDIGAGTGLGLSTVHAIVKSHGGFINVYSEVGKGTTFRIYLPALAKDQATLAEETKEELPIGHGELILAVDDEASIREITKGTLEAHGYKVIAVSDGTEAVATYAQKREEIKAVITDLMMPDMDGAATIRALQRMNPEVRVIAVSGMAVEGGNTEHLGPVVKAFLGKPYTAEKLLRTLDGVLKSK